METSLALAFLYLAERYDYLDAPVWSPDHSPLRKTLGIPYLTGLSKENKAIDPLSMEKICALIEESNPRKLDWVSSISSGLVQWLMIFKLFRKQQTVSFW